MKLSLIACATALALSACAWAPAGADRASSTSGPTFRYAIEGPPNIGVVQPACVGLLRLHPRASEDGDDR